MLTENALLKAAEELAKYGEPLACQPTLLVTSPAAELVARAHELTVIELYEALFGHPRAPVNGLTGQKP